MTLDELAKALLSKTEVVEVRNKESDEAFANLTKVVEEMAEIFGESLNKILAESKAQSDKAIEMVQLLKGQKRASQDASKAERADGKNLKKVAEFNKTLLKELKSQNTVWFGISKFSVRAQKQLTDIITNAVHGATSAAAVANRAAAAAAAAKAKSSKTSRAAAAATTGGTTGGGSGGGKSGGGGKLGGFGFTSLGAATAMEIFGRTSMNIINGLDLNLDKMFEGAIKDTNIFRENMRSLIYQVEGFSAINRDLEQQYFNIEQSVNASGVARAKFQEVLFKNRQRGLQLLSKEDKLEKDMDKRKAMQLLRLKSVQTTALNTSQQLDMNADSMNETFMNWHYQLGMSALQMSQMGREMRGIAKETGITGERLEKAVSSSEKIMKALKKSGNLSSESARNTIKMTALMEKHGVGEEGAEMLDALSGAPNFLKADPKLRSLLMRAGGTDWMQQKVMSGAVMGSKSDIRELGVGYDKEIKRIMADAGFTDEFAQSIGLKGIDPKNISELNQRMQDLARSDPQKHGRLMEDSRILQMIMDKHFGGIGVAEQMSKVFDESGKGLVDEMMELRKQIKEANETGKGELRATKELKKRLEVLESDSLMSGFTTLAEETKKGLDQGVLKQKLTDSLGEQGAKDFMQNMPQQAQKMIEIAQKRASDRGMNFEQMVQSRGFSVEEIKKGLIEGNEASILHMKEIFEDISVKEKTGQDPATDLREDMRRANNKLSQDVLEMSSKLDKEHLVGIIAAGIGASVIANVLIGGKLYQLLSKMANKTDDAAKVGSQAASKAASKVDDAKKTLGAADEVVDAGRGASKAASVADDAAKKTLSSADDAAKKIIQNADEAAELIVKNADGMLGKLTKLAKVVGKFAWPLQVIFAAFDGMIGAIDGYTSTAENFSNVLNNMGGKTTELTGGMTAASTAAGGIVGILDGLSFGLLGLLGIKEPLEKFSSWIIYSFIQPFEETFKGFMEGIKSVMNSKEFGEATAALQEAFANLRKVWQDFSESIGLDEMGKMFTKWWDMAGPFFKQLGQIIGILTGEALMGGVKMLTSAVNFISEIVQKIKDVVDFIRGVDVSQEVSKITETEYKQKVKTQEVVSGLSGKSLQELEIEKTKQLAIVEGLAVKREKEIQNFNNNVNTWMNRRFYKDFINMEHQKIQTTVIDEENRQRDILKEIEKQIASQKAALETTADTMEQGQKEGSIYVHDVHLEALLEKLISGASVSGVGLGAFDPGVIKDAFAMMMQGDIAGVMNTITGESTSANGKNLQKSVEEKVKKVTEKMTEASAMETGAFVKSSAKEAMEKASETFSSFFDSNSNDLNKVVETARVFKSMGDTKESIESSLSKALYDATEGVDVSSNLLGNVEDATNVNPLMTSPDDMESAIEQKLVNVKPSSIASMSDMDVIVDYLTKIQARKLDAMVNFLEKIENNTRSGGSRTKVIGPNGGGLPVPSRPGIKKIANDIVKGFWNLQPGDYAPSSVNTDGRGGNR